MRLVGVEEHDTFTMNTHYFVDAKAAFLARLKKANLPCVGTYYNKVFFSLCPLTVCHACLWLVCLEEQPLSNHKVLKLYTLDNFSKTGEACY